MRLIELRKNILKIDIVATTIIILGSILWSLTMVKSGWNYPYGVGFWGPNGHDGVWHMSIIENLSKGRWDMPIFTGEQIKNYHIGFDFAVAAIHKFSKIPVSLLYFQILPPIFAIALGIAVFKFTRQWSGSERAGRWALFFTYFSGSFGWIITWFKDRQLSGESLFWSQQSISTLVNPPYALSLVMIFFALYLLVKGVKNNNKNNLIISTFLFGFLIQVKVYAGIIMLTSLFVAGCFNLLSKKGTAVIKVFVGSLIVSILVFDFIGKGLSGNLVFRPYWFLETMVSDPERIGWQKYAEAMVNYKLANNWFKGTIAYLLAFIVFVIGNFGLRIFAFKWFVDKFKKIKEINYIEVLLITASFIGLLIPTFFIQKGNSWNSIQFLYYTIILFGIISGIVMDEIFRKNHFIPVKMFLILVLVLFSLASAISTLRHYIPNRPPAMIPNKELAALNFLRKLPDGVVLTIPFNENEAKKAENHPPRPLYLYESTAYVSAYSGKKGYFEDSVNLEITGYDWRVRQRFIETNICNINSLANEGIKYFYIPDSSLLPDCAKFGSRIYNEDRVVIIQI